MDIEKCVFIGGSAGHPDDPRRNKWGMFKNTLDLPGYGEVEYLMRMNPDLFPNRFHAIHHMFCVLGTGYEWKLDPYEGEHWLVNNVPNVPHNKVPKRYKDFNTKLLMGYNPPTDEDDRNQRRRQTKEIVTLADMPESIYPITSLCPLANMGDLSRALFSTWGQLLGAVMGMIKYVEPENPIPEFMDRVGWYTVHLLYNGKTTDTTDEIKLTRDELRMLKYAESDEARGLKGNSPAKIPKKGEEREVYERLVNLGLLCKQNWAVAFGPKAGQPSNKGNPRFGATVFGCKLLESKQNSFPNWWEQTRRYYPEREEQEIA